MSAADEYFEYRVPTKFLGEIQIVLSTITLVSGLASIASFSTGLDSKSGHEKDIALGYITYSSLAVGVGLIDVIFGAILISGTNNIDLTRCLLWRGSAITTLVLFGLLTLAFMMMVKSPVILLAFIPTLLFKPFALWVVKGFVDELRQLESFSSGSSTAKSSLSLQSLRQLQRTTTIFKVKRGSSIVPDSLVVMSKICTIPEEQFST